VKSSLTFITGNTAKALQVSRHLSIPLDHTALDLVEIQSLELSEIVKAKAKSAYEIIKKPVLVEDVSLTFEAMGKLPGPFIKWFHKELGNEGLCRMLDIYENRNAFSEVMYGLHTGHDIHLFHSSIKGSISMKPQGDEVFGYDPIFIPDGFEKTWAEMSQGELDNTSMRKNALKEMEEFLQSHESSKN
jgi:non-canonical purine NTP pyrophosphatase (RdgB/HAM1 family)